jgi:hypothetical protein
MIEIPLKRSREAEPENPTYIVTAADVEAWRVAFPGLNIDSELAEIAAYCRSNPERRWTRRGVQKALHTNLRAKHDRAVSRVVNMDSKRSEYEHGKKRQGPAPIPDYGNFTVAHELGEMMIAAAWQGRSFEPPPRLVNYNPKVNIRGAVDRIVERVRIAERGVSYAYGAFYVWLLREWERSHGDHDV